MFNSGLFILMLYYILIYFSSASDKEYILGALNIIRIVKAVYLYYSIIILEEEELISVVSPPPATRMGGWMGIFKGGESLTIVPVVPTIY
jgi:hypothetical protein